MLTVHKCVLLLDADADQSFLKWFCDHILDRISVGVDIEHTGESLKVIVSRMEADDVYRVPAVEERVVQREGVTRETARAYRVQVVDVEQRDNVPVKGKRLQIGGQR